MRYRRERKRDYRYGGRWMVLPGRDFVPRRREPVANHYWRRLEYGLLQDQPMKRQGMKIPHLQGPASRPMTTPMPNRAPVHSILHLQQRYDYKEDLGLCGWTFPASWYIEIGKDAFSTSK